MIGVSNLPCLSVSTKPARGTLNKKHTKEEKYFFQVGMLFFMSIFLSSSRGIGAEYECLGERKCMTGTKDGEIPPSLGFTACAISFCCACLLRASKSSGLMLGAAATTLAELAPDPTVGGEMGCSGEGIRPRLLSLAKNLDKSNDFCQSL